MEGFKYCDTHDYEPSFPQDMQCEEECEGHVHEEGSDSVGLELNDQIWHQLQHNDPSLTSLHAYWKHYGYINGVNWREKGVFVAKNTCLKHLTLEVLDTSYLPDGYWIGGDVKENFDAFCESLTLNRSIERLDIKHVPCMGTLMEILGPFIEQNANLSQLVLNDCYMDSESSRLLTAALSNRRNKTSLRRLELIGCTMGGQESSDLITVLNQHHPHLNRLCLGGNEIGLRACIELGKMLRNPHSRLEVLHLESNEIDDECVETLTDALSGNVRLRDLALSQNEEIYDEGWENLASILRNPDSGLEALRIAETSLGNTGALVIAQALVDNTKLRVLDLHYNEEISFDAWRSFFMILQNSSSSSCVLEEINLSENNIDDEVAVAIANAFANVGTLNSLQLDDNKSIGTTGWRAISDLLERRNDTVAELNLSMNDVEDGGAVAISSALASSPTLRDLDLSSNRSIGTVGWKAFSSCFRTSQLVNLDLSVNGINDEAATSLSHSLMNVPTLKTLKLTGLDAVTANGWRAVLSALAHPNSSLEELKIDSNNIDDVGAIDLANALTGNKTLRVLDLDADESISHTRWHAFSRLVWDPSSIMSTYLSNHTLHQICSEEGCTYLPGVLVHSLQLNRNSNKNDVARYKILMSHFQGEHAKIQEFLDMEYQVLPAAFAWLGRNSLGHSLLYRLVRTMPTLAEHGNVSRG